jgi:hypothetical protein
MIILTALKYITLTAVLLVLIAAVILLIWSWNRGHLIYAGDKDGVSFIQSENKRVKISLQQALVSAEPYLQQSLEQIRKRRGSSYDTWGGRVYVILKGDWYYIFKDDYPWKAPVIELPGKYDSLAIRVNTKKGELILPTSFDR